MGYMLAVQRCLNSGEVKAKISSQANDVVVAFQQQQQQQRKRS
jgi:hypothetical protein